MNHSLIPSLTCRHTSKNQRSVLAPAKTPSGLSPDGFGIGNPQWDIVFQLLPNCQRLMHQIALLPSAKYPVHHTRLSPLKKASRTF